MSAQLRAIGRPAIAPQFKSARVCRRAFAGARRPLPRPVRATSEEVDLEAQVEQFMKRQAEIESGAAFVRSKDVTTIIGGDVVSDEMAQRYCADIFEVLKTLKRTRDMSFNEVKLIVSIEDPRARERRAQDIEDERGVSRDEMAQALVEVGEGRVPNDRIALKCLHDEMLGWPFLEVAEAPAATKGAAPPPAPAKPSASDYASLMGGDTVVKPYVMGDNLREGEKPQNLTDMLPGWVGYGVLYGVSAIPVLLVVGTILILFYNSLK
ncbi:hypothetical protein HYH02_007196 [Chlamydomonas schloesseri]|uniref:Uncharacterized protein n=1 Tax=Chlamydomonas schloesseri TaxID=2026947 RepID=A0A835WIF9_9CHLO|nr:hypothetical protein HYH02_007196 [Chlamydomonas schloesseri]|eukprot:KAG2447736.1 hypothetical protein HYH02_007196 [Chlamydomonas schloesseri]